MHRHGTLQSQYPLPSYSCWQVCCGLTWLNSSTLCPVALSLRSSLSSTTILPLVSTMRSSSMLSSLPRKSSSTDSNRKGWLQIFLSSLMMLSRLIWPEPLAPARQHSGGSGQRCGALLKLTHAMEVEEC